MGTWAHGGPREGIGMVGRCSPASVPSSNPTIPNATLACDGDDVPTPAGVPGRAGTGTRAAAPAGRWDNVEGAGREGRGAQEGMGQDRVSREEPEGERCKGHGWGGQGGGGEDERDRQTAGWEAQAVQELQWAWADLQRRQERVQRAEREGRQQEEGGGPEGRPPLMPIRQPAIPPE